MPAIYKKPHSLKDVNMHYCPGCTHSTVHRLIAEVIDELGIEGRTIGIASVGCSYCNYNYFNFDMVQAAHGRAPAVATGIKRSLPERIVLTYQGDGDLAAIGTAEIVHAAARGENITTVFINNTVFAMTSGQMAPTTLLTQVTQTTPSGRNALNHGFPLKVTEMIATIDGAVFLERTSMHDIKNILNTKKAIKKAFMVQMAGKGFSMVEVLSSCPSNWGVDPVSALKLIKDRISPVFPIGNIKGSDMEV